MDHLGNRLEPVSHTLFGTDGVRGRANVELTPELALALGRAIGRLMASPGSKVVLGRDTRRSGPMLEAALVAGLTSVGIDVLLAGIVPTPAISFLIKDEHVALGIVVSASHNPPEDNGIKLFDAAGLKLSEEQETAIADELLDPGPREEVPVGGVRVLPAAAERYAAFLTGSMETEDVDLQGVTIVVDCAYGATGAIAPRVLEHFKARVIGLHTEPLGDRINHGCGVGDLSPLRAAVLEHNADLGIAFDGDGDRVLVLGARGELIDGDIILGIAAEHLHRIARLDPPVVVATVLSNQGLANHLAGLGATLRRTQVGDRYVAREMRASGAQLGGEKSGHIIFGDHSVTGDGILTAVKLLEIAHAAGAELGRLARAIPLLPQVQRSLAVEDPEALLRLPRVAERIQEADARLNGRGRVLVRASGTQPLVRVMVEADVEADCIQVCASLCEALAGLAAEPSRSQAAQPSTG
jgi:phosphoglucosamine mutase